MPPICFEFERLLLFILLMNNDGHVATFLGNSQFYVEIYMYSFVTVVWMVSSGGQR